MSCDNSRNDTFDALFALYQKGSLDIQTICDLLDLNLAEAENALGRDFREFDDARLNEVLRSAYGNAGKVLAEGSGVEKIAVQLGFEYEKPKDADSPGFADDSLDLVPCPACEGVGWTALFMYRRSCEFCESAGEVEADKWLDYTEE